MKCNDKMLNAQSLENAIHQAQQQLQSLKKAQTHNNTQNIVRGIDTLFNACNHFAEQLEQVEQQENIAELESQYIALLIDLTEYDAHVQGGASREIFQFCS